MATSKTYTVTVSGGGVHDVIRNVKSHEIVGLPAGTYHKIVMPDGMIAYYNDFGVRIVTVKED